MRNNGETLEGMPSSGFIAAGLDERKGHITKCNGITKVSVGYLVGKGALHSLLAKNTKANNRNDNTQILQGHLLMPFFPCCNENRSISLDNFVWYTKCRE